MSPMNQSLLEVTGVWKRLCRRPEKSLRYGLADIWRDAVGRPPVAELRDGEFWALQDVDFQIEPGQVVGVIGHNGAGKSTLINLVSGVILPTLGSITLRTPRVVLIDHGGGLNPIETGRENALTQLALHGLTEEVMTDELRAVEVFAGIGDFIDAPVGTYSLGMRLRLAFAIYSRLKPDLFIIDEALGGGDDEFRNKFRSYLRDYIDAGGSMLLCSHEMLAIQAFCHRCLLLDRGRVVMTGSPVMAVGCYQDMIRSREAERPQALLGQADRRKSPEEMPKERCVIEAMTITADDGGAVTPGCAVTIEITVVVAEEIGGVACGIEIGRGEVVSLATLAGGYPTDNFVLLPPITRLSCRIDRLPLAPGAYDVRVSLSVQDSAQTIAMLGYRDSAIPLAVVSGIDERSNLARHRNNILHISTEWSVSPSTCGEATGG